MVSASSRAISVYVVSFFEAPPLAHGFWNALPVPPACMLCLSLTHHPLLTVSVSSRATSLYVVSFFDAPPLAYHFGSLCVINRLYVLLLFVEATTPCSWCRSLRVPSACMLCLSLTHPLFTVSAFCASSSDCTCCSFKYNPALTHPFYLHVCPQHVRGVDL